MPCWALPSLLPPADRGGNSPLALRSEGLWGICKGFLPTWMRKGPHHTVVICVLGQLLLNC